MNNFTPWSYRKGSSLLHRLPAGLKLIFLLALSLAAFFPNLAVLASIAFTLILLSFVAGIGPRELLRGSRPLFFVILAVLLLQGIEFAPLRVNFEGLWEGIVFCLRIGVAYAAGTLLFAVTTTDEIRKSLSRLEAALHLKKLKLGLSISLMLGFIKRFFEIWEDINLAWKSRGGKRNLSRLIVLVPLAFEKMIVKAAETATALESRNGEQG